MSEWYISADDPKIEHDLSGLEHKVSLFSDAYKGKVAKLRADELLSAIKALESIQLLAYRLEAYAYNSFAAYGDDKSQALLSKIEAKETVILKDAIFFELELNLLNDTAFKKLKDSNVLADYRHWLGMVRIYKPNQLSEPEEKILAEKTVTSSAAFVRLFDSIRARARFDYRGKELGESEVISLLSDDDRQVRKDAARSLTKGLEPHAENINFIYNNLMADKEISDRLRGYTYPEEAKFKGHELKLEWVDAMIDMSTKNYQMVASYYQLKKRLLGYDKLYVWDRYAPIGKEKSRYTFDQAQEIVLSAFNQFSPEKAKLTKSMFDESRIDAQLRPGKRGGAYCIAGGPPEPVYVLTNYSGKSRDVSTLAHELGHAVHSLLAQKSNSVFNFHPTTPMAETASVFAEILVFDYLKKQPISDEDKLALLTRKIEDSFATIFRQVSMFEFEREAHRRRRSEGELDLKTTSEIWQKQIVRMFGDSVDLTEGHKHWWTYVTHFFHSPFYVYSYAWAELQVLALYSKYLEEGDKFVPTYFELLKSGGSRPPAEIMAKAGFDVTSSDFWETGIKILKGWIKEADELASHVKA